MNTTETTPELQPCPERPRRTGPPVGGFRILTGYAMTALALLCGIPVLVVCLIAGNSCHSEGFACLGWLVYGLLGGALVAAAVSMALAVKSRLGIGFWLVMVAVLTASLLLQHDRTYATVAALASPGAAAWLTEPVRRDSHRQHRGHRQHWRHWLPRLIILVALAAVLPISVQALS